MPSSGSKSRASRTPTIIGRSKKASRIRALNDQLRTSFGTGLVTISQGVRQLGPSVLSRVLAGVREFNTFETDNDPHGEHDFGALVIDDYRVFWKIDYFDTRLEAGSEDPSSAEATMRVLTIMLASEY